MNFVYFLFYLLIVVIAGWIFMQIVQLAFAKLWPTADPKIVNIAYALLGLLFLVIAADLLLPTLGFRGPGMIVVR